MSYKLSELSIFNCTFWLLDSNEQRPFVRPQLQAEPKGSSLWAGAYTPNDN